MDDQAEQPTPELTHVWIRPKPDSDASEHEAEWVRTPVVNPLKCGHEQTICLQCAESWSNDHDIRYEMPDEPMVFLFVGPDGEPMGLLVGTRSVSKRRS